MKGVDKNTLKAKTDDELYRYLRPDSRAVAIAIRYAFEILSDRGCVFSEEEGRRIEEMIAAHEKEETIIAQENHKKAATLLYISAVLCLLSSLLLDDVTFSVKGLFMPVMVTGFLVFLGMLVERGADWVKYLLLLGFCFGLFLPMTLIWLLLCKPVGAISIVVQWLMQAGATV
jgi:hypothetical protein